MSKKNNKSKKVVKKLPSKSQVLKEKLSKRLKIGYLNIHLLRKLIELDVIELKLFAILSEIKTYHEGLKDIIIKNYLIFNDQYLKGGNRKWKCQM